MKKLLLIFACLFSIVIGIQAQSSRYTGKIVTDRFGDLLSYKEVTTLVGFNDSCLVIETKGLEPIRYKIIPGTYYEVGTDDDLVEIVRGRYGYFCIFEVTRGGVKYQVQFREFSYSKYSFVSESSALILYKCDQKGKPTEEKIAYSKKS